MKEIVINLPEIIEALDKTSLETKLFFLILSVIILRKSFLNRK
ncbi:MAG: hypothetical protein ACRCZO_12320 [Cetobacterium sp.]